MQREIRFLTTLDDDDENGRQRSKEDTKEMFVGEGGHVCEVL